MKHKFKEIQRSFFKTWAISRGFKEFQGEGKNSRSFKECVNPVFSSQIFLRLQKGFLVLSIFEDLSWCTNQSKIPVLSTTRYRGAILSSHSA